MEEANLKSTTRGRDARKKIAEEILKNNKHKKIKDEEKGELRNKKWEAIAGRIKDNEIGSRNWREYPKRETFANGFDTI